MLANWYRIMNQLHWCTVQFKDKTTDRVCPTNANTSTLSHLVEPTRSDHTPTQPNKPFHYHIPSPYTPTEISINAAICPTVVSHLAVVEGLCTDDPKDF